jgi:hypothetical protein
MKLHGNIWIFANKIYWGGAGEGAPRVGRVRGTTTFFFLGLSIIRKLNMKLGL